MILKSIILGVLQGLTEFLPISSSGHLMLVKDFIGFKSPGILFEVFLHFATLIAIFIVFAKRIWKILKSVFTARIRIEGKHWVVKDENLALFFYLLWASIPSAIVGLLLKSSIEKFFSNTLFISIMLLVTGSILFSTRFIKIQKRSEHNGLSATLIGVAQAFAIIPGISRSGATISAGLWAGLSKEASVEFSFILVIPAILGAMILELKELSLTIHQGLISIYIVGALTAFITGLCALLFLLRIIKKGKLHYFSYYCWLVGVITLILELWIR